MDQIDLFLAPGSAVVPQPGAASASDR